MSNVLVAYVWRIWNVSATYIDILAYAWRLSNVLYVRMAIVWLAYGQRIPNDQRTCISVLPSVCVCVWGGGVLASEPAGGRYRAT